MLRRLLVALALSLPALADDAVDLQWKARTQDLLEYGISSVSTDATGKLQVVAQPDRKFQLFGYEIDAKGTCAAATQYTQIASDWLLLLPASKVRTGSVVKLARPYDKMSGVNPFSAVGTMTLQGYEEIDSAHLAVLVTKLELVADKHVQKAQATQSFQTVSQGSLEFTQWFDPERGLLVRVQYDLQMRLAYSDEYKKEVKKSNNSELKDYEFRTHEQWDLKGVQDVATIDLGLPVKDAIDKGVAFLRTKQGANDGWEAATDPYLGGPTALVLLAMLKSGVSPKDPAVEKGFAWLRKQTFKKTYCVGLTMMAIEAKYISPEEVRDSEAFMDGKKSELKLQRRDLTKEDTAWMLEGANWLAKAMTTDGAWSYEGTAAGYDHSNSQYGLLGLLSAARCGIMVPTKTWQTILDHWLATQEQKGPLAKVRILAADGKEAHEATVMVRGWGYNDVAALGSTTVRPAAMEPCRGSMTCAGIAAVCMARSQLSSAHALTPEKARAAEAAVLGGVAWMEAHYTVKESVYGTGWYYYYMYGLERAMVLAQHRFVGDHDWYKEGAIVLIGGQTADGAWAASAVETSFAVLFLKRATTPIYTK